MGDLYQEVDEIMSKLHVGMHKIKPCSRKYAFELRDIPKEADYLKLMYPYESTSPNVKSSPFLLIVVCRATLAHGVEWRDIHPRLRQFYCTFRAICSVEADHGPVLAQD